MALIKCKSCGKDISDSALKCPHCGCVSQSPPEKQYAKLGGQERKSLLDEFYVKFPVFQIPALKAKRLKKITKICWIIILGIELLLLSVFLIFLWKKNGAVVGENGLTLNGWLICGFAIGVFGVAVIVQIFVFFLYTLKIWRQEDVSEKKFISWLKEEKNIVAKSCLATVIDPQSVDFDPRKKRYYDEINPEEEAKKWRL